MAFEVEEKKSFLDNLQQAVGIGSQVAQVAGQFKQLQQADKRIELEKQDMLQRKDYFAAQAQHFKALQERQAFEMDQMRQAVKQKSAGYVFGQIANMVDMYGDIQDEKLRSSAFDGFLQNNGQFLADAGKQAGFETANDPMKFNDFLKNRAKAIAPFMVGMRNDENNLLKQISMPDQVWKPEEAANLLQTYAKSARKVMGQLPPDMAEVVEKNLDDMRKQIDAKNARVGELSLRRQIAGTKAAGEPADDAAKLFKLTQQGVLGKLNELASTTGAIQSNMEQFIQNPTGYGDFGILMQGLKGLQADTSVIREAEMNLGKNATSLINKALNAAEQLRSGKSLQPEQRQQMMEVFNVMVKSYRSAYQKAATPIAKQAQAKGVPLDMIFSDPSLFQPQSPEGAQIQGINPPPANPTLTIDEVLKQRRLKAQPK